MTGIIPHVCKSSDGSQRLRPEGPLYKLVGAANHILPDNPDTPENPDMPDSKVFGDDISHIRLRPKAAAFTDHDCRNCLYLLKTFLFPKTSYLFLQISAVTIYFHEVNDYNKTIRITRQRSLSFWKGFCCLKGNGAALLGKCGFFSQGGLFMKKLLKTLVAASLVGLTAISFAGCGGGGGSKSSAPAAGGGVPKDTIVVGMPVDPETLDPAVTMDNKGWQITYPAYERLVKYKTVNGKASTEVEPSLAKEWKVSDDGLVWTFTLNEGHKFADGSAVDANAVKFSIERVMKMKKGPSDYFKIVKSIEAPDAKTVVFTLDKPFAPFLYTLAVNGSSIVNPKVMEKAKDNDMGTNYLATHTMGSGAYEITSYTPSQSIKLDAQKNYAGKKPAIQHIVFNSIKDPSAQRLQLEKGDIDIAEGIPMDQLDQLKDNKDIKIYDDPSLLTSIVYLNNQKGPTANKVFRQALSYAIDYNSIIEGAVKGKGKQLTAAVPQGMWGRDDSIKGYTYDVNKAKELLAASGENVTEMTLLYSGHAPFDEAEALIIQNNLSQLGIKVNLEKVAWATFRQRADKGDFQMALGTWSPDYSDPQFFLSYWLDSSYWGLPGNRSFYKNDSVDKMLREAEVMTDKDKRTEIYKKVQAIAFDEAPYLFLFQTDVLTPMRANIKGFSYNPMLDSMFDFEALSKS